MRRNILFLLLTWSFLLSIGINANEGGETSDRQKTINNEPIRSDISRKLEQDLLLKNKEIDKLKEEVNQLETEKTHLNDRVKTLETENQKHIAQNDKLTSTISANQATINQLGTEIRDLKDRHSTMTKANNAEYKRFREENERLKEKYTFFKKAYTIVSVVLYSNIAFILVFLFTKLVHFPSKCEQKKCEQKKDNSTFAISKVSTIEDENSLGAKKKETELRCPLCGWKYNPGQKVCKNCNTQF